MRAGVVNVEINKKKTQTGKFPINYRKSKRDTEVRNNQKTRIAWSLKDLRLKNPRRGDS